MQREWCCRLAHSEDWRLAGICKLHQQATQAVTAAKGLMFIDLSSFSVGGAWETSEDVINTTCQTYKESFCRPWKQAFCRCMSCNSDLKGTRPVPLGQLPSRQGLVPNPDPVAASRDGSPSAVPAGPGLNAGVSVPTAGGSMAAQGAWWPHQQQECAEAAPWLLHNPVEAGLLASAVEQHPAAQNSGTTHAAGSSPLLPSPRSLSQRCLLHHQAWLLLLSFCV